MNEREEEVLKALKNVQYPGYKRDIVSFGFVKGIQVRKGEVSLILKVSSKERAKVEKIVDLIEGSIKTNLDFLRQ